MNGRERFSNIIWGNRGETPIWLMRQAGRCLPEYRELRKRYTFKELIHEQELAVKVSLQPIKRFGLDAAILFSDILVIPEALGQEFEFQEGKGISLSYAIRAKEDFLRLRWDNIEEQLAYVGETLTYLKKELNNKTALIGFSGSPFTLANYMIAGGGCKTAEHLFKFYTEQKELFEILMSRLTDAVIRYLNLQIAGGGEVLQIFDSCGHLCPVDQYEYFSLRWIKKIIQSLPKKIPIILFSRVGMEGIPLLMQTGAGILSVSEQIRLKEIRKNFKGNYILQGNLSANILSKASCIDVIRETKQILFDMQPYGLHIFNLGHGINPETRLENIEVMIQTIREFKDTA